MSTNEVRGRRGLGADSLRQRAKQTHALQVSKMKILISSSLGNRRYMIVMVIIMWFFCSSLTQVENKNALLIGLPPVSLVYSQMALGALIGVLLDLFAPQEKDARLKSKNYDGANDIFDSDVLLILSGILNALGHTLTMWSTTLIPVSLAHSIRATELCVVAIISSFTGMTQLQLKHWLLLLLITIGIAIDSVKDAQLALSYESLDSATLLGILGSFSANSSREISRR